MWKQPQILVQVMIILEVKILTILIQMFQMLQFVGTQEEKPMSNVMMETTIMVMDVQHCARQRTSLSASEVRGNDQSADQFVVTQK